MLSIPEPIESVSLIPVFILNGSCELGRYFCLLHYLSYPFFAFVLVELERSARQIEPSTARLPSPAAHTDITSERALLGTDEENKTRRKEGAVCIWHCVTHQSSVLVRALCGASCICVGGRVSAVGGEMSGRTPVSRRPLATFVTRLPPIGIALRVPD